MKIAVAYLFKFAGREEIQNFDSLEEALGYKNMISVCMRIPESDIKIEILDTVY